MTRLALIRHGPTAWNAERRLQGRTDVALSADGRARVAAWSVPEEFREFRWVASPLSRTVETATLLCGNPPPTDAALIEMSFGAWEGRTLADLRAEFGAAMVEWEALGLDFRAPGGESPRDVQDRLRPWLRRLEEPTIAVTHKGVIRAVYALAAGWDMTGEPPDKLRDACIHVFVLAADGWPRIERLNVALEAP